MREQGEQILQRARADAGAIAAQARTERERILAGASEQGFTEGSARGWEKGHQQGREEALAAALVEHAEELKQVEDSWLAALAGFSAQREDLVQGAMRDVLRLAVNIAERITKRAIQVDPRVIEDQLAAVLAVVVRPTELVIRINPADRPTVEGALPGLLAAMPAIRHAEIVDDPTIDRGGCVARTRADAQQSDGSGGSGAGGGEIDARIETQLDRIVQTILPGEPRSDMPGEKSW